MRGAIAASMRRSGVALVVLAAAVCWPCAPAVGGMSRSRRVEVFYAAQRAYEQGVQLADSDAERAERLLREAANGFQALADDGVVNGRLYYNLGNAYLRLREIGRAILCYRKARPLMSDDDRLAEGLRVARSVRQNDIPEAGQTALIHALLFWHYGSTLRGRAAVCVVAYAAFWLSALGATFLPHVGWRYVLIVLLIVWVALAASVGASAYAAERWCEGVIVADDVVVGKDPGLGSSPAFEEKLHSGVEFELLERDDGWYHIQLPNGKSGWIARASAELI